MAFRRLPIAREQEIVIPDPQAVLVCGECNGLLEMGDQLGFVADVLAESTDFDQRARGLQYKVNAQVVHLRCVPAEPQQGTPLTDP